MICLIAVATICGICLPVWGIALNQVDDFENGTLMSWSGGAAPTNIANGGPAGAGDNFLQIQRLTLGNLGTTNAIQWTGDYLTAGVSAVQMDLNHFAGSMPVNLRIFIFGLSDAWASTNTTLVASGWNTYTFGLSAADLVQVQGADALADTLSNVVNVLIRHDTAIPTPPGSGPPAIIATVGLDNIRAVPEPASVMLLSVGCAAILRRRQSA